MFKFTGGSLDNFIQHCYENVSSLFVCDHQHQPNTKYQKTKYTGHNMKQDMYNTQLFRSSYQLVMDCNVVRKGVLKSRGVLMQVKIRSQTHNGNRPLDSNS